MVRERLGGASVGRGTFLAGRAGAAADWLVRSIQACGRPGLRCMLLSLVLPLAPAYPENHRLHHLHAHRLGEVPRPPRTRGLAIRQARWILSLQLRGRGAAGRGPDRRPKGPASRSSTRTRCCSGCWRPRRRRETIGSWRRRHAPDGGWPTGWIPSASSSLG